MPTAQPERRKQTTIVDSVKQFGKQGTWRGQQKPPFPRALTEREGAVFALDTNVLMTRPEALFGFDEHPVLIPWKVLLELDHGKRAEGEAGMNARRAIEYLVTLVESVPRARIHKGIPLVEPGSTERRNRGKLFFGVPDEKTLKENLDPNILDQKILLECLECRESGKYGHKMVMVSKDKVMRILALLVGLPAEDYFDDAIDTTKLTPGILELPYSFLEAQKKSPEEREGRMFYTLKGQEVKDVMINDVLSFPIVEKSKDTTMELQVVKVLATREVVAREMINFQKRSVFGAFALNREQSIATNFLFDPSIKVVILEGPAGSGKNFVTLLAAYHQILEGTFERIVATREAVPDGRETGFKPGTEFEKMLPWMGGMTDNTDEINQLLKKHNTRSKKKFQDQEEVNLSKFLVLKELNSIRGRSLRNTFVIFDESQNSTREQQKLVLTRHGKGSKTVCLGNFKQTNVHLHLTTRTSGFARVISIVRGVPWAAHVVMPKVERSEVADFFEKNL